MTRISFLLPTFNRAAFLGEALAAILPQMGDDDELLVIDDGSTDSTREVVAKAGSRVRYVRQDNAGKSAALNRALSETDGEFIVICDDDDRLRADAVDRLVTAISDRDAHFVFGRYTRFEDPSGRDLGVGYWPDLSCGSLLRHILEDAFVMQNAALVRMRALAAVGPFSDAMKRSMDYEMFVRLACSWRPGFVDAILFDQRKHSGPRGPHAMSHRACASMNVWNRFDRAIFENLHRHAPLDLFEAMFEAPSDVQRRRAALLQRAAVMARHDCWDRACDDLEAAARIQSVKLDAGEYRICNRALGGKHGVDGLANPIVRRRLSALRRTTAIGRQIVHALLAGGLWRLRGNEPDQTRVVLAAFVAVSGVSAPFIALRHKLAMLEPPVVIERPELPSAAYLKPGTIPPVAE